MREYDDAIKDIYSALSKHRPAVEITDLATSLGRVLAEDFHSPMDVPPAANSAMDGYALSTTDAGNLPITLDISQRVAAGKAPKALQPGTAARIFTGAEIPPGADCVVMQENCTQNGDGTVTINEGARPQGNIRPQGQDIGLGDRVLTSGTVLRGQELALLASMGFAKVPTFTPVKVAVFSTGDELIQVGQPLEPGQIYDSNRIMIESMCKGLGCTIVESSHIPDNLETTTKTLQSAAQYADIIVSCGGVSVGDEDHVKTAVDAIGRMDFWKINIKPGKPFAFGEIHRADNDDGQQASCTFIGLPGNPVSAFSTMTLFGKTAVRARQGLSSASLQTYQSACLFSVDKAQKRTEFARVNVMHHGAERYENQSSGVLSSVCWANGLAIIPANTTLAKGDTIQIVPLT